MSALLRQSFSALSMHVLNIPVTHPAFLDYKYYGGIVTAMIVLFFSALRIFNPFFWTTL